MRNPVNFRQISRVILTPDVVDGIVFWTKNPAPMVERLDELKDYTFYFQFSITPYGKDIEPNIPQKDTDLITTFKRISETIGTDRIIWRYDPILLSDKYNFDYHIRAFRKIANELHNHTRKVTISFIDTDYKGLKSNLSELKLIDFPYDTQREMSEKLASIAHEFGLSVDTCAEKFDLSEFGIRRARCIDDRLFSKLLSCTFDAPKDKNQRLECGCISSVDIGMYNSCENGCLYCYANYNKNAIAGNRAKHNPLSPLLFDEVGPNDKVSDRPVIVHTTRTVPCLV